MGLDRAIRIPVIATEIVLIVLPTTDTDMAAGIMVMVIKAAVNVVAMVEHRAEPTGINELVKRGYFYGTALYCI